MQRGEIRLVDLDPVRGAEANRRRPAVIVRSDGANQVATRQSRGMVTVVPVTATNTEVVHPSQVLLQEGETGLDGPSKAQAEQIRSVPVARVGRRVGAVGPDGLAALDEALRLHLAL